MDAMSDIRYGREDDLTDIPVPAVHAAQAFIDEEIPHWVYYCMGPRGPYLNRFFDTPLAKIRMSGWLFYKLRAQGFLHWGYNYWYVMDLGFNRQTQVLVDNGGTVVLGGIFEQNERTTITKVPVLGDIPVVGYLFKNRSVVNDRTELMIFITPRVVSEALATAVR